LGVSTPGKTLVMVGSKEVAAADSGERERVRWGWKTREKGRRASPVHQETREVDGVAGEATAEEMNGEPR
jgi:hypothetical protein